MRGFYSLVAFAAALTAASGLAAEEKAERPKEKKVCRTVQVSGRVTPMRVCRKVERPAPEAEDQRDSRNPEQPSDRRD
jgi:hypothetical protein